MTPTREACMYMYMTPSINRSTTGRSCFVYSFGHRRISQLCSGRYFYFEARSLRNSAVRQILCVLFSRSGFW